MKENSALKDLSDKSGLEGQKKRENNFDIKRIFKGLQFSFTPQKIIFIAFGISVVFLAVALFYPLFGPKNLNLSPLASTATNLEQDDSVSETKPYDFYLQGIQDRQIFAVGSVSDVEPSGPIRVDVDAMRDMNLIGVVAGDNPQAIIEDKKAQKVYYLNKGQFIGEFKVEDIQESKVILNRQGEKFELHL